jgi:hypothetical protein
VNSMKLCIYKKKTSLLDNFHIRIVHLDIIKDFIHQLMHERIVLKTTLTLSDFTSNLIRKYDFPVPLRCRKTFDTGFVAFVRPMSEPVRRFVLCITYFSQQIAQVLLFLFLRVFFLF